MAGMRRFYREVAVGDGENGWTIALDGRSVRTPGRGILLLPTRNLADAVAAEWQAQQDEIRPRDMPLTQLANSALDRTRPHRTLVIDQVAAYGETDLLCYRVAEPPDLAALQAEKWQPVLDWLAEDLGARLTVTQDIAPVTQPQEALLAIYTAVARHDDFALTGLHSLTAASGSVAIGLALSAGRLAAEEGWKLAQLDELYQIGQWGDDADAAVRRNAIRDSIAAATSFIGLSRATP